MSQPYPLIRCTATYDDVQCDLDLWHEGLHQSLIPGRLNVWSDPRTPIQRTVTFTER